MTSHLPASRTSRSVLVLASAIMGTLAFLAGSGQAADAATTPTVTFLSVKVSGHIATIKYKVNRKPSAVATRTCTLDSVSVRCGVKLSSTRSSTTYKVTLRNLAIGDHEFVVAVGLAGGQNAGADTQFNVSDQCQVTNSTTKTYYGGTGANLQTAINEVSAVDYLEIRGVCIGNFSTSTNLNLVGVGTPQATLDGNGAGVTLTVVTHGTVLLTDLTITGGSSNTLGGGVRNDDGALILNGATSITGNTAPGAAGIYDGWNASLIMNDSASVSLNTALSNGAGVMAEQSPVTLNDASSISHNTTQGSGGGIYLSGGTLTMTEASSISSNSAQISGGGIYSVNGPLVGPLAGVNVTGNTPENIFTVGP